MRKFFAHVSSDIHTLDFRFMRSLPARLQRRMIPWAAWVVFAAAAQAEVGITDLKQLSLEQLTQVEVNSVSRRSEKLIEAAAAVEVLAADRIIRAGANTLPDALRLATGVQVSQLDGREWTISSRGFATVTSNKMEVNQDGRSLYGPLFSGVLWDVQSLILEDLDRIEVVRGPGAALWGANAVNGVISIVTKSAEETQGSFVNALIGSTDRQFAVRFGGAAGSTGFFRISAQALESRGLLLVNGTDVDDDRRLLKLSGRWDLHPETDTALTLQASTYRGLLEQYSLAQHTVQGGYGSVRLDRPLTDQLRLHVLSYYDHAERQIPRTYSEIRNTAHFEMETELNSVHHAATLGVRAHVSADRIGNGPTLGFDPSHSTIRLYSLYGQDRYTLPDGRWKLTVGSTLEHNTYTGVEFQPTIRLSYSPATSWMAWVGASRAVRTPSRIDTNVAYPGPGGLTLLAGSPSFRTEDLESLEAGWRWHHAETMIVDVNVFENRYDHLRSIEPGTGKVLFVNQNLLKAKSNGLEISSTLRPWNWGRLILGARYLDQVRQLDPESRSPNRGQSEGDDARRIVTAQFSFDLPHNIQFDVVLRHVSALPLPYVSAYTTADLRLAWRANRNWDLAISGRNLFAPSHAEGIQPGAATEKVRRAGTISVTWRK